MYVEYNPNPSGRRVGDCAVRAMSKALGVDWDTAAMMLNLEAYYQKDMPNANHVWGEVLKRNGFKRHIIPNECPDCYTLGEFANEHTDGVYVVALTNHVVCIANGGKIYDSWDSSNEIPLYFWEKEK